MKSLTFKLVIPITIFSFLIFTKWWYVIVIDGTDEIMYGFPLIYTCRGFATSMSYQFFVAELLIDLLTYFLFWLIIIYFLNRFLFTIRIHKVLAIILITVALIPAGFSIYIMTWQNNLFLWKRDFQIKKMGTGYKFLWQEQVQPDLNTYHSRNDHTFFWVRVNKVNLKKDLRENVVQNVISFKMGTLTQEIKEFVKQTKLGFVATVCPDGTPNLSPKGTTTVWDDEHLVFADIHSPGTVANLLANPSIEINIVDVFTRKGYRFKGIAKVVSEGSLFDEVIAFYKNAGSKYIIHNIILVKVERIIPLLSPVYDTGISEDDVIERWTDHWNAIYTSK